MFCDHEIPNRKLNVTLSGFIRFFVLLLYINCILVIRHPGDGHKSEPTRAGGE